MIDVEKVIRKQFAAEFAMTASPLKEYCISGVKKSVPVLVQITTPCKTNQEAKETPPIAIACVLDRSGSMSGSKLKFAIRAICKVIKHLGPKDVFHLVAYDDRVTVPIQNGDLTDKAELKKTVRGIRTGGSTNIADALTRAASLLDTADLPTNALKRIYLFSDGVANAGEITSSSGLSELAKRINKNSNITVRTRYLESVIILTYW